MAAAGIDSVGDLVPSSSGADSSAGDEGPRGDHATDDDSQDVSDPSVCNQASSSPGGGDSAGVAMCAETLDPLTAWADVPHAPLTNAPVATIPYSPRFASVFGLLLVARERGEASPRALALVSEATRLCAADFSTWGYRMVVVRGLLSAAENGRAGARDRADILLAEDKFVRTTALAVPKSYQLWEYRRFLFELKRTEELGAQNTRPDAQTVDQLTVQEREFVEAALDDDEKNYHAWSHLGWLARDAVRLLTTTEPGVAAAAKTAPQDAELLATGARIRRDVRNNSAYSHRWAAGGGAARGMVEVQWALDRVRCAPRNEAAWNYVLALARCVEGATAGAGDVARDELAGDGFLCSLAGTARAMSRRRSRTVGCSRRRLMWSGTSIGCGSWTI
jgi:protein farnesyltransferase/geranylgeranyltransferase type-1 subunit alpha